MSCLLRKLDQKTWLDPEISEELGGLSADSLKNFKTSQNCLSVFVVDGEESIKRIITAIACRKQTLSQMDYAIFDYNIIEELKIKVLECPGKTADDEVNELHLDLNIITADNLIKLVEYISKTAKLKRMLKKRVIKEIVSRVIEGDYKLSDLHEGIRPKVQEKLAKIDS